MLAVLYRGIIFYNTPAIPYALCSPLILSSQQTCEIKITFIKEKRHMLISSETQSKKLANLEFKPRFWSPKPMFLWYSCQSQNKLLRNIYNHITISY